MESNFKSKERGGGWRVEVIIRKKERTFFVVFCWAQEIICFGVVSSAWVVFGWKKIGKQWQGQTGRFCSNSTRTNHFKSGLLISQLTIYSVRNVGAKPPPIFDLWSNVESYSGNMARSWFLLWNYLLICTKFSTYLTTNCISYIIKFIISV